MDQKRRRTKRGPPFDLFGEVPVTWGEVELWVEAVAGIGRDSWRFDYYCTHWNVPAKIRAAKLAGTFEALLAFSPAGRPPDPLTAPRWRPARP